jgi:Tol biopolymer transport system component
MDLATRETTTFGIAALSLRWAPQSNRIAYLSDADRSVWVINADGTGARKVSTSGRSHQIGIDWSPDEQWLLVTTYESGIELINVATGATLPIPFARGLTEPVWKP